MSCMPVWTGVGLYSVIYVCINWYRAVFSYIVLRRAL